MELFFSKQQCGIRKGYSTQYRLSTRTEVWKSAVHKRKYFGALTELTKAVDCLSRELLLAKVHVYSFSLSALRLVHSDLTNKK